MRNEKNKFNALTPEVLNENKPIYTEALDYAFGNSDIKNIAITGIYGAGKSTVWNTYVHQKGLNNVITVSLGKYKNNINDDDSLKEVSVTELATSETDGAKDKLRNENQRTANIDDDNRVERQLINQILSQIESKKIPLSKYGFKSNKSIQNICLQSLAFLSIICSILLWITRDTVLPFVNDIAAFVRPPSELSVETDRSNTDCTLSPISVAISFNDLPSCNLFLMSDTRLLVVLSILKDASCFNKVYFIAVFSSSIDQ